MKCFLWWFHDWNKWEIIEKSKIQIGPKPIYIVITGGEAKEREIGVHIIQKRECKRCGLAQFKSKNIYV